MIPRSMLSLVHVSRGLDVGGQERLLADFARFSDRAGFHLHFLSLTSRGPLADVIAQQGWPVTALEQPEGLRPAAILELARFFARNRFDIVHTHDDKPLLYSSLAATLAGVNRLIHTHHHGPLPQISRRHLFLVRLASLLADRFVCVSQHSARYMIGHGVSPRRVLALPNGIDLDRFAFSGPAPDGPAVCVARLSPEKDIANLLHAAAILLKTAGDFRLEIAGDGPLRRDLERLAEQLHLGPAVRFLGEVSDVPALLRGARLFVLPSKTEGISLTILEAMARGLPVVATRVGGNPEVVLPGETGILVAPGDPQALAQGLLTLWADANTAARMGEAGRERVKTHFDVRKMIERYEAIYRQGLRGGSADPS